ncbi:hypothetical protein ACWIGI_37580 [Nocardia sp. NPDC055321]
MISSENARMCRDVSVIRLVSVDQNISHEDDGPGATSSPPIHMSFSVQLAAYVTVTEVEDMPTRPIIEVSHAHTAGAR